jgi:hypothetical protein
MNSIITKPVRRILQILACSIVLLSWSTRGEFNVASNIVQNGDFGYWPQCCDRGPADWTWTVNIGAAGFGMIFGTVSQQLPTIPGQAYHLQFSMGGNPDLSPPETLNVYWENNLIGSTAWYPNGPGHQNPEWIEGSYTVVATMFPSLLTFENTKPLITAPFLTDVSVVAIPEPSTLMLVGLGACILTGLGSRKNVRVF